MQGIRHHLIDIIDITQEYTVANFNDDAKKIIKDITKKGKIPILCGGTGLYFRVLLQDFDLPRVAPDKLLREKLELKSSEELYKQLQELDIQISKKIHPNNKVKIIRALEVCIKLNKPMSEAQKKKKSEFNTLWIGLNSEDRDYLYERINKRVDIMFEKGLLNEVKNLYKKYGKNNILTGTIGYQELLPYIDGITNFEDTVNLLKQNTRRYAKRQISWFNSNQEIKRFDIKTNSIEKIIEETINYLSFHT